ncbi:MAG: hypothetical protein Kow0056_10410 [Coriobacteriia bacterium]
MPDETTDRRILHEEANGRSERRTRLLIYAVATVVLLAAVAVWALSGNSEPDASAPDAETTGTADAMGTLTSHGDSLTAEATQEPTGDGAEPANSADSPETADGGDSPGSSGGGTTDGGAPESGADDGGGAGASGRGATFMVPIPGFDAPQTYEAQVEFKGWQSEGSGMAYLEVRDARLLGPISAETGEEMGPPPEGETDHSSRFEDIVIVASTSEAARGTLGAGEEHTIRLVLLPAGGGAVFHVERDL